MMLARSITVNTVNKLNLSVTFHRDQRETFRKVDCAECTYRKVLQRAWRFARRNPAHAPIINDFKNIRLKNLDYMREIEAQSERALAIAEAFDLNGPGLYVDKYLRNFLREYNVGF